MDDSIVTLRNTPIALDSDVGRQFVVDCVRAGEGLITDRELAEKYELDPPAWIAITKDVELGHAIRAERERRVLNGVAAREAAAKHFVKAPGILDQIMTDANASEIATLPQARASYTTTTLVPKLGSRPRARGLARRDARRSDHVTLMRGAAALAVATNMRAVHFRHEASS